MKTISYEIFSKSGERLAKATFNYDVNVFMSGIYSRWFKSFKNRISEMKKIPTNELKAIVSYE